MWVINKLLILCILFLTLVSCRLDDNKIYSSISESGETAPVVADVLDISLPSDFLKLNEAQSLGISGGEPPYTVQILSGAGNVNLETLRFTPTQKGLTVLKITDSLGNSKQVSFQSFSPGDLDLSFGSHQGFSLTETPAENSRIEAIVEQPDGQLIVAGAAQMTRNWNDTTLFVARYKADGSGLDTSFAKQGRFYLSSSIGVDNRVKSIGLQSDGKIILAGQVKGSSDLDMIVFRLNTDGSLDTNFGSSGFFTFDSGLGDDALKHLKVLSDDSILLVGYETTVNQKALSLVKLNPSGFLDTSFDTDGRAQFDLTLDEEGSRILLDGSGNIYALGSTTSGASASQDVLFAKFLPNGSLDTSFSSGDGSNGYDIYDYDTNSDYGVDLFFQSTGKILVGSFVRTASGGSNRVHIKRYETTGLLDPTFNMITTTANFDYLRGLVLGNNDQFFAVGTCYCSSSHDLSIWAYNADGTVNTSVGVNGRWSKNPASQGKYDNVWGAISSLDGNFFLFGSTNYEQFVESSFIYKMDFNIQLRAEFGVNGILERQHFGFGLRRMGSLLKESSGNIALFGGVDGATDNLLRARFLGSGVLDTQFLGAGIAIQGFSHNFDFGKEAQKQSDGKIVQLGYGYASGNHNYMVVRYNTDYTLDLSFAGGDGKFWDDSPWAQGEYSRTLKVLSDDKILVSGNISNSGDDAVLILKLNADGSVDTSFGASGWSNTNLITAASEEIYDMEVQSDGKIVVVGSLDGSQLLIARFLANGSLDTTFSSGDGSDGFQTFNLGGSEYYYKALILPGGGVIAIGKVSSALVVSKFLDSGALDTSFGSSGHVMKDYGSPIVAEGYSGLIEADGKITVVGAIKNALSNYDVAIWSLNSNGSDNTAFGNSGYMTYDILGNNDWGKDIIKDGSGYVIGVESSSYTGGQDWGVLRVLK